MSADAKLRPDPAAAEHDEPDVERRIYRTIFDSVMNQRLTPGARLPETQLCELFGVSRAVVRRVLQRLAHDHIVELRPNRGAIVAIPTPEETRQIFEARQGLEAAVVRLATRNGTPEDFADMRRHLREEHEAMHRFDQPSWARLASAFHLRLAAVARNPILEAFLNEIVTRCSLIVALYQPWGNASCEHDEHARIVERMEAGDAEGAIRLMHEHLVVLERNVCLKRADAEPSLKQRLGLA